MISKYYNVLAEIADRYKIMQDDDGAFRIKPDENTTIFLTKPFKIETSQYTITIRKGNKWIMLWKGVNHVLLEI